MITYTNIVLKLANFFSVFSASLLIFNLVLKLVLAKLFISNFNVYQIIWKLEKQLSKHHMTILLIMIISVDAKLLDMFEFNALSKFIVILLNTIYIFYFKFRLYGNNE